MQATGEQAAEQDMQARLQATSDVLCNEDLLKLLFDHLTRQDLCCVGATCRLWQNVANSDEFWSCLDFSGLSIQSCQVTYLERLTDPDKRYVRLASPVGSELTGTQVVTLLNRHPGVQVLNLRGVSGSAALFKEQELPVLSKYASWHDC